MKKFYGFLIAGLTCALLTLIFFGLVSITEPTLTHEQKLLWFTLWTYKTLNPTFMFLSILSMVSSALTITFMALSLIFSYFEWKEMKKA